MLHYFFQLEVHVVLGWAKYTYWRGPWATLHRIIVTVCKVTRGNGLPVQLHVILCTGWPTVACAKLPIASSIDNNTHHFCVSVLDLR
jgi:hypothetical protein